MMSPFITATLQASRRDWLSHARQWNSTESPTFSRIFCGALSAIYSEA